MGLLGSLLATPMYCSAQSKRLNVILSDEKMLILIYLWFGEKGCRTRCLNPTVLQCWTSLQVSPQVHAVYRKNLRLRTILNFSPISATFMQIQSNLGYRTQSFRKGCSKSVLF